MFYTETVASYFHLYGSGNPRNRADIDDLVAGFADINIDSST
jgi:hypothetical protein